MTIIIRLSPPPTLAPTLLDGSDGSGQQSIGNPLDGPSTPLNVSMTAKLGGGAETGNWDNFGDGPIAGRSGSAAGRAEISDDLEMVLRGLRRARRVVVVCGASRALGPSSHTILEANSWATVKLTTRRRNIHSCCHTRL
jgi:hypothetical protein